MILNPIKCEICKREIQPEDIGLKIDEKNQLIRVCLYCGSEVIIK